MKKALLFVLLCVFTLSHGAHRKLPQNIKLTADTVYVKADTTVYTKKFSFANDAWKVGKIAFRDTNIVDQDTIVFGSGVKVRQELCFTTANVFGYDSTKMDTLCSLCGDTNSIVFDNAEGLSADSIICNELDTTRSTHTSLGGDSLWVSDGYFNLVPDPSSHTRFKITGNSDMGSVMMQIIVAIWSFDGYPVSKDH